MQYQLFVQSLSAHDAAEQKFVASVVEMPTVSGEAQQKQRRSPRQKLPWSPN
ncbi:MAG: hypothetical protein HC878_18865 [Leptolyngbyaceae cyanobacterium SL_5_14]|nr:hypothetical protein [Leptolyngbyaceae cyanobacterium SL_5_14]